MLFRWAPSESLPVFSYWVCGRQYLEPEPKECYVAYHESTPQQMVELCFRLSLGSPLVLPTINLMLATCAHPFY